MEIKKIEDCNVSDIRELVTNVFMKFEAPDYSDEGITAFFDTTINNQEYMCSLAVYGAYIDHKLVGTIATRNNGNHIALFFVDGSYHGQGIGRQLFKTVVQHATAHRITVNSSPYAKDIYHHFGFKDTDEEQIVTGIRFIPMLYKK